MAKSKSASKKSDGAEPKKRGNPGDFHGARRAFLFSRLDDYCKQSAEKTTRTWWADLWKEYWALFPWEIPISQEPPADLTGYGKLDSVLTAEEIAQKKKTVDDTQVKIKRWLGYARRARGGANPFMKWLGQLRRVEDRAPKRLATYQVYMQDEENNARINELFEERYPEEVGKKGTIKFRGRIARELFEEEDEEIKEEYRQKVEEEYEDAMAEFKAGAGADVAAETEEGIRFEARERLAVTVQPLLDAIRAITGSQVLLITGAIVDGKFDIRTLHAKGAVSEGVAEGLDFTAWDTRGFKGVMDQWMRYLHAAAAQKDATGPLTPRDPPPPTDADAGSSAAPTLPNNSEDPDGAASAPDSPSVTIVPSAPANPTPAAASTISDAAAEGASSAMPEPRPDSPPSSANEGLEGAGMEIGQGSGGGDEGSGEEEQEEEEDMDSIVGRLDGLSDVRSPLKRAVRAMTPDRALQRVEELRRRDGFFRRRESNIAEREEMLKTMAPSQEIQDLITKLREANKKRPSEGELPRAKRVKKAAQERPPADNEDYSDGEGDDGDDGDEGGEGDNDNGGGGGGEQGAATGVPPRPNRAGKGRGKRMRQTVEENGVPLWASSSRGQLLEGGGGEVWEAVVDLWWRLETAAKFKGPAKGANVSIRPAEVKGWVARARTGGPVPAVKDLMGFTSTWWKWWCAINPKWRTRLRDGHRLTQESDDGKSWDGLAKQTGPNGLLLALICLRWWKDAAAAMPVMGDAGWEEAVKEVHWTLKELAAAAEREAKNSSA
ncbi:hypothetical protein R3P38DRAFT_2757470 [Favolaschia claudopus]|uniref:Uncharacterized protein n=1 Tax=Favolaschia claudopus TaxID=2862362 RepID=A0AAW0EJE1_9AGAR